MESNHRQEILEVLVRSILYREFDLTEIWEKHHLVSSAWLAVLAALWEVVGVKVVQTPQLILRLGVGIRSRSCLLSVVHLDRLGQEGGP